MTATQPSGCGSPLFQRGFCLTSAGTHWPSASAEERSSSVLPDRTVSPPCQLQGVHLQAWTSPSLHWGCEGTPGTSKRPLSPAPSLGHFCSPPSSLLTTQFWGALVEPLCGRSLRRPVCCFSHGVTAASGNPRPGGHCPHGSQQRREGVMPLACGPLRLWVPAWSLPFLPAPPLRSLTAAGLRMPGSPRAHSPAPWPSFS